jgi:hypothetical protein
MRPGQPDPKEPDDRFRARLSQQIDRRHPRGEAVRAHSLERVSVDATVQPKAIAHPLDSRLYHRGREILVRLAKRHGVPLRQSYARLGKKALRLASRYGQVWQMKRARREIKRLKTYLGRVLRDVRRKLEGRPEVAAHFDETLAWSGCWRSGAAHRQEQALRPACAGTRLHRQRQGAQEVRVRRQGRGHESRRPGRRHADPRRQPLRRPDAGAGARPGRTAHRHAAGARRSRDAVGDAIHALLCGAGHNLILRHLTRLLRALLPLLAPLAPQNPAALKAA